MVIVNADAIFEKFHWYKVYNVLKNVLHKNLYYAFGLTLGCLILHRFFPEAYGPGIALHLVSVATCFITGGQSCDAHAVQLSPLVTSALYLGGKDPKRTVTLCLYIGFETAGILLAVAIFGFYYSFRFP